MTNWVIPGTKQGDIDLLILGPHGALVCEVKTYAARYAADGDNWYSVKENGYRKPIKSPSRQLKRNAAALQKYMRENKIPGTVHQVLVLNDRIDLDHTNPSVPTVFRRDLAEHVATLPHSVSVEAEALGVHS